uniref:Rx N-terminal domain-containing protein n=1 Tax=Aegilops tauschii subsp. strangulata TaxID=200361 RepID=A0A453DN88_AEGTS
MADRLAIAVSKSVVVGAITKIQSAIDEDARLRQKVKRDLVFITLELEMMQSFLDDANEEMKNNLVKTWVKHIRQLGYEVEDCVKNVVQLDDKPIFWRRLLPSWMTPPLPLDLAVEDLEHLRARVEDVNNCYRRYHLINESAGSKMSVVIQKQRQPPVPGASDMLAEARAVTKRQHGAFGDLTKFINKKDNDLQVISLWGAAGDHGTTSIIRDTYNHAEVCKNFAYRSWVKVVHPFSPHDFIRSLMAQFYANFCREQRATVLRKMEVTQEDLFNEFEKIVTERTYLIVLEGLSNMVDWDAMRALLPDMKNGSWIIVSTQHHEIARLCIGQSYQILELKQFSEEHSVCALFKSHSPAKCSLKRKKRSCGRRILSLLDADHKHINFSNI